jgi:phage-related protein
MNVFELFAKLGLDSSEYENGLDRARGMISSVGGAISVGVGAIATATTAAIAATSTALVNGISDVASYADSIDKMSQKLGMSAEAYQEWDFIMQHAGTSIESMQASMKTLASAAETGNAAFEQLGITQEEIAGMSQEELFGATIEALQNVEDETQRTYLAGQLLGRGATELGALLNMSAEEVAEMRDQVHELGGVMSDEAVSAGAAFQDSLQNVQTSITGLRNNILSDFLPSVTTVMDGLASVISGDNSGLVVIEEGVQAFTDQLETTLPQVLDTLASVIDTTLPSLIETILPALLNVVGIIFTSVASALPSLANSLLPQIPPVIERIVPVLISLIPTFISIGGEIIRAVITGLVENAGEIAQAGLDVLQTLIDGFAEATSGDGISQLIDTTMQIVEMIGTFLVENAPTLITAAVELITQLAMMLTDPTNLQMLIDLSLQLILAIADGLVQSAPALGNAVIAVIGNLLTTLWNELPNILSTIVSLLGEVGQLVIGLVGGLMGNSYDEVVGNVAAVGDFLSSSFENFITGLTGWISNIGTNISQLWTDIVTFFTDGITNVGDALSGWWDEITSFFSDLASSALNWAGDMVDNFVSGIRDGISSVGQGMSEFAAEAASWIHFSEPDKGALSNFSTFAPDMVDLWNETLTDSLPNLSIGMGNMSDYIADNMPSLEGAGDMAGVVSMPPIVVQAYFGQEKIDEVMVESNQRIDYISGGRA